MPPNYQRILQKLETDLSITSHEIKKLNNLTVWAESLRAKIRSVRLQMSAAIHNKTEVTDHAVLRYLERVENINTEKIRKKILSRNAIKIINQFGGNGSFSVDNIKITVVNNKIVTIF